MARKKKQTFKNSLALPFPAVYLLLAVSLLVNAALASFVFYVHTSPQADIALVHEGISRACGSDYQYYLNSLKTDTERTNYARTLCNRDYPLQ